MGGRSKLAPLLQAIEASELARERTKVMLLTLCGDWRVKEGLKRLALSRTRFSVLRRRMLQGALEALEPGATGRPRKRVSGASEAVCMLLDRVAELEGELRRLRTRLELAEGPAARAVALRVSHFLKMKRRGR